MNSKPYQSLSRARPDMELRYSSSSEESEEGTDRLQQPYSHTHADYSHDRRLAYNSHRVKRKTSQQPNAGDSQNARHKYIFIHMHMQNVNKRIQSPQDERFPC